MRAPAFPEVPPAAPTSAYRLRGRVWPVNVGVLEFVPAFLAGGGQMGGRMRSLDWSRSPLGRPAGWPQPLKTIVGVMLAANQPMFAAWGPEQRLLYNDGYAEILGGHHPAALGRPFFEVWSELVDSVGPIMRRGYAGEPTYMDDIALVMHRNGFPEPTHFSFFYAPVRDEDGRVGGVFCACNETTRQVLGERARREAEARNRQILDSAVDYAVIATDLGGRITCWNEGARRILGWTEGEMLGQTAERFFTPEDRASGRIGTEMRCALETGAGNDERWHLRNTGERFWAAGEVTPLRNEAGQAVGFVKVLRDRTEQRLAESRLRESEDNHRHAVELSPQTVWTARPDGQLDHVGPRWREWTGTSGLGASWRDAIHPDDLAPSMAAWARSVATGEPYDIEHRVRLRDGSYRWMHSRAYPRRGEAGAISRWYGTTEDIHAARAAEEALRESEERFRNMADHAPVMMWVTDPSGYCAYLNRRWYEFTGQSEEEALGLGWTNATHPDDQKAVEEAFLSANAAQGPFRIEYRLRRADGAYRWAIDAASPRFGDDGAFLGYVGSVIDIDERKREEARRLALDELAERIRDIDDPADLSFAAAEVMGRALGVSRAGYGTIDPVAETITIERDWNAPGIRSLAGVLRFRDYGSYIEDLKRGETVVFADAEKDPRTAANAGALKAIGAQSVVNMPVTEQGGTVALLYLNHAAARGWSADELAFVREAAGRTRTAVERRRAEQSLRGLAASLERLVEERTAERDRVWRNSRDLLAVVGADGVFRAANPAWTAILGHEPAEVVGRSFLDFVWPEDADLAQGGLDAAASGEDLTNFESRWAHKDGTPRWFSWHTSAEGDLVYAYGRDVTAEKGQAEALRRAEERLRQSQKMEAVGQLTGGIAHDFNNLLTGITGSLELLNTRVSQGRIKDVDRYIAAAQGAAKRAAALTHRLLAFSRRQTLDPKPIDANRLVSGMEELVRRTVGPEVAVEVVAAGGLWTTLVDPNQLENALLNLCINARDAMPEGGKLTIETGNKWLDQRAARDRDLPPGQYITLCVSDTGGGMTPEVVRRAFDPFFTTKPIGAGTGLGLSMVYGFARQSGGQARIYSETGQGTMVCLYLPRHLGEAEGGGLPAEAVAAPRAARGETVLVVDDEPTVRMLVAEVLEDLGYTAVEAADGAAGLKVLRSDARVDLLVTDVGLPGGLNGRQVADAARALRPGLKVLFITGYAENAVLSHGHLGPGMHVLTKPFAMDVLASRIKDLIAGA